jgi:hypothetical protein
MLSYYYNVREAGTNSTTETTRSPSTPLGVFVGRIWNLL